MLMNLKNLTIFDATYNDLSGSLPLGIGEMTNLESLDLSSNFLRGTLPESLGDMTSLVELKLHDNSFDSGYLSCSNSSHIDSIPSQLGQLTSLTLLTLSCNVLLMGSIPSELGLLTNLQYLWLSYTYVTGTVPEMLCQSGADVSIDCDFVEKCTCCTCDNPVIKCSTR
jgi:Leucine-rich repeat (LRR) protein